MKMKITLGKEHNVFLSCADASMFKMAKGSDLNEECHLPTPSSDDTYSIKDSSRSWSLTRRSSSRRVARWTSTPRETSRCGRALLRRDLKDEFFF